MKIEKEKFQRVVDWPVLRSIKDVQKFLELANYYRQFIKDFTGVPKLLYKMMRKDVKLREEIAERVEEKNYDRASLGNTRLE